MASKAKNNSSKKATTAKKTTTTKTTSTTGKSSSSKKSTSKKTTVKKNADTNKVSAVDKIIRINGNFTNSVTVYKSHDKSSAKAGTVAGGEDYRVTQLCNGFYYIDALKVWVKKSNTSVISTVTTTQAVDPTYKATYAQEAQEQLEQFNIRNNLYTQEELAQKYTELINKEYGKSMDDSGVADELITTNLNGIYGIPYQFPSFVDTKISGTSFGQIYSERIISRMPLLMLSPGKMDFMSEYDDETKTAAIDALMGAADDVLNSFIDAPGKYYTFKYDSDTYWRYVNGMNHACAIYLGIEDVKVNINGYEEVLKSFHWEKANNNKLTTSILSNQDFICFYCDAKSSKSESFSNETTPSQLASKVNDFSALAKEVQFILGSAGKTPGWLKEEQINAVNATIEGISEKYLDSSTLFTNVAKEFAVIATGGKLAFPEIWSDSSFTQSFDIDIKLRCPCPNKLQWYLDICVPLNLLIAMTMSRTPMGNSVLGQDYSDANSAVNGYMSPFLVRAFHRGMFTCDMGIITELSIEKGKEGSWTLDGLPSEVDVSLTIKDLYSVMFQTCTEQKKEFLSNTTFMNYLANSCGININAPDIERSINMWMMLTADKWKSKLTPYSYWQKATQGFRNKIYKMYQGVFPG